MPGRLMQTKETFALANFVWNNYLEIQKKVEFWQLLSLLDRNEDKIVFIKENGKFTGAAFYLRLSDENFLKVVMDEYDLTNPEHLAYLLTDNGDNIHFVYVVAHSMKIVLRGLKKMIKHEKPVTVSWFKPSMDKIHIVYLQKESELCLQ